MTATGKGRVGKMILASIRMTISPEKRNEVLRIFRSNTERNKALPGCLNSRLYEDLQVDNVILFEEMWSSEEEMEKHLQSDDYRKVLMTLEMALQRPEVRFMRVSSSNGIEVIEKARSSSGNVDRH
jgi:quinol monooxygenase YgiN